MYHCIICHAQFDLKSLEYTEEEGAGICVPCLYSGTIDWEADVEAEENCFFCKENT